LINRESRACKLADYVETICGSAFSVDDLEAITIAKKAI
jgi:hypothetical protein